MNFKLPIGWMYLFALVCLVGCSSTEEPEVLMEKFEIHLAQTEKEEGWEEKIAPQTEMKIYLHPGIAINNDDIQSANYGQDDRGLPAVFVRFKSSSHTHIAQFSSGNIGKMAAIVVNGQLLTAPVIRSEFSDAVQITGNFTVEEARHIARAISSKKRGRT